MRQLFHVFFFLLLPFKKKRTCLIFICMYIEKINKNGCVSVYVTIFSQNHCFFFFSSCCCSANCERAITSLRLFPFRFRVRTIRNSKTIKMFHINCQKKTLKTPNSIKEKENQITLKRFVDIFNRLANAPLFARFGYLSNNRQSAYTRYEMNCWHTKKKRK